MLDSQDAQDAMLEKITSLAEATMADGTPVLDDTVRMAKAFLSHSRSLDDQGVDQEVSHGTEKYEQGGP